MEEKKDNELLLCKLHNHCHDCGLVNKAEGKRPVVECSAGIVPMRISGATNFSLERSSRRSKIMV